MFSISCPLIGASAMCSMCSSVLCDALCYITWYVDDAVIKGRPGQRQASPHLCDDTFMLTA